MATWPRPRPGKGDPRVVVLSDEEARRLLSGLPKRRREEPRLSSALATSQLPRCGEDGRSLNVAVSDQEQRRPHSALSKSWREELHSSLPLAASQLPRTGKDKNSRIVVLSDKEGRCGQSAISKHVGEELHLSSPLAASQAQLPRPRKDKGSRIVVLGDEEGRRLQCFFSKHGREELRFSSPLATSPLPGHGKNKGLPVAVLSDHEDRRLQSALSKHRREELHLPSPLVATQLLRLGKDKGSPTVVLNDQEERREPARVVVAGSSHGTASDLHHANAGARTSFGLQTKERPNDCLSRPSRPGGSGKERKDRPSYSEGNSEMRRLEAKKADSPSARRLALEPLNSANVPFQAAEKLEMGGCKPVESATKELGNGPTERNTEEIIAYARVRETIRLFNKHYLRCVQVEEQRCRVQVLHGRTSKLKRKRTHGTRRPDLKAITEMNKRNQILYPKTFGNLKGIDVGRQFYSRAEMVALGLHSHWLKGIDCISKRECNRMEYGHLNFPIATSIVMSGQYEDDIDNLEDVVYTGEGGNNLGGNKRQIGDQKLKGGNLALKNNMVQKIPVRVIRGHASNISYVGKVYTYDGLYEVVKYWAEIGVSGFTVFKYHLRRFHDQPALTTNQVNFSGPQAPRSTKEVRGLVSQDISGGLESRPIPATNVVDCPPVPPSGYVYCNTLQIQENLCLPPLADGCSCKGSCVNPQECACARLNGSGFPYVQQGGGRLVEAKAVVFECGPNCGCGPDCVNRTSQQEIRYQLEVFRTTNRGWGVRSWDHIPPGVPICEYKGVLMRTDELDTVVQDSFIFEIDCLETIKGLDGRKSRKGGVSSKAHAYIGNSNDKKLQCTPKFCIDAGHVGNVSRFINHSCQPNLFVQCILSSHRDIKQARIVLFAAEHIPPLQELTYDYGIALDSVVRPGGHIKKMPCYCGAPNCRKRLY